MQLTLEAQALDLDNASLDELTDWLMDVAGWYMSVTVRQRHTWVEESKHESPLWPRKWNVKISIPWTTDYHWGAGDTLRDATACAIQDAFEGGHNGTMDQYRGSPQYKCEYRPGGTRIWGMREAE